MHVARGNASWVLVGKENERGYFESRSVHVSTILKYGDMVWNGYIGLCTE